MRVQRSVLTRLLYKLVSSVCEFVLFNFVRSISVENKDKYKDLGAIVCSPAVRLCKIVFENKVISE